MARCKRLVIPGMPHHIVQRGNHRMNVFLDDADRFVFLRMLDKASKQYGLINLGYNLMTNHALCGAPHKACYVKHQIMCGRRFKK